MPGAPAPPPPPGRFAKLTGRFKKEELPGKVTRRELMVALGTAIGVQAAVSVCAMSAEALLEKHEVATVPAEVPMAACGVGFLASVAAFKHKATAGRGAWVKWRWFAALPPLQIVAVIGSAILVRGLLVPETPPLPEDELAEVVAAASALGLKCFTEPGFGLNPEACVVGWSKIFKALADAEGRLTAVSLRAADPAWLILRGAGCERLVAFLQAPEHSFCLEGALHVFKSADKSARESPDGGTGSGGAGVSMRGFALTMLALQSAAEGNASHQCELLFRLFNTAGNGQLSAAEFGQWMGMLLSNELSASAFETDAIVDRWGLFGGYQQRLTPAELTQHYFTRFDKDRDGALSFGEFNALCSETNLRFGSFCLVAQLLEECAAAVVAGQVLQLLVLNPQAGKLPQKEATAK